jgi:hypothetical protein
VLDSASIGRASSRPFSNAPCVKALLIVGPLGPIHSAFNAPQFFPRLDDGRAELLEDGIGLPYSGNIAGADIQADHTGLCLTALRRLSLPARARRTSGNGYGFDGE